jgi:hypothetical protein
MEIIEGEILKNKFTEDLHVIKKIEQDKVILENRNGSVCILLYKKNIGFYYEKIE